MGPNVHLHILGFYNSRSPKWYHGKNDGMGQSNKFIFILFLAR
jgi:hypothetical protein